MIVEFLPGGRRVRVAGEALWQDRDHALWRVPAGLVCDGASIPRPLWWLIGSPLTGKYRTAAIFHDAYYKDHCGRTRKQVDRMFLEKMREDGVGWIVARALYAGVRAGGWRAWTKEVL